MYLHYILNEDTKSMLSKFFFSQNKKPLKGDWCLTIQNYLKLLELHTYSFDDIKKFKKTEFKSIVSTAVKKIAFSELSKLNIRKTKLSTFDMNILKCRNTSSLTT